MSGGFKWEENVEEFTEEFISALSDEEDRGFMLEVDLEYPSSLHDSHDQYPLGECCYILLNASPMFSYDSS